MSKHQSYVRALRPAQFAERADTELPPTVRPLRLVQLEAAQGGATIGTPALPPSECTEAKLAGA